MVFYFSAGMGAWHSETPGSRSRFLQFLAAFLTHRFAAQFDTKSIVDKPIKDAIGDTGIANLFVPVRDRNLRG